MKTSLLKTKTFWTGIAAITAGIGLILTGDAPNGINSIVSGLLAIFIRDGIVAQAKAQGQP